VSFNIRLLPLKTPGLSPNFLAGLSVVLAIEKNKEQPDKLVSDVLPIAAGHLTCSKINVNSPC
jgi:hypothetical protein